MRVEENAEQGLQGCLEQLRAWLLSELPQQFLGEILESELVQSAAKAARILRPQNAQQGPALLKQSVHRGSEGVRFDV
jgi:hypothetical protein